jgi:hypothetical protein
MRGDGGDGGDGQNRHARNASPLGTPNVQCYSLQQQFQSTVPRSRLKTRDSRRQEPSVGKRHSPSSSPHCRHQVGG